jgi:hypothetical protein
VCVYNDPVRLMRIVYHISEHDFIEAHDLFIANENLGIGDGRAA